MRRKTGIKTDRGGFPARPDIEEGSTFFFDEDDPENKPKQPGVPEDETNPLWSVYRIHPGLPYKIKVEQLVILWNLDAKDIAAVLGEDLTRVTDTIRALEEDWTQLGEGLNEEEKRLARGKLISELRKWKAQLEAMGDGDAKVINMKLNISDRIAKLQGVESEKKAAAQDDVKKDLIEEALEKLTPEARRNLMKQLGNA